jgi:hypothetical protein
MDYVGRDWGCKKVLVVVRLLLRGIGGFLCFPQKKYKEIFWNENIAGVE